MNWRVIRWVVAVTAIVTEIAAFVIWRRRSGRNGLGVPASP
ncbi:MAG TPA: hypothetical protein VFH90_10240 [Candidatus Limnocylindria bacterium]|nr:hypothetical protein [Candidatus Limnocylindria bacterium]